MEKETNSEQYITFVRTTEEQAEAIRETGAELLSFDEVKRLLGFVGVENTVTFTREQE